MPAAIDRVRIVLGNASCVGYPEAGGLWFLFAQYVLGLLDLQHDPYWIEFLARSGDADLDNRLIGTFLERAKDYGFEGHAAVVLQDGASHTAWKTDSVYGISPVRLRQLVASSDMVWNFANALPESALSAFRRRVLIDIDPGLFQLSALDWDMGIERHDVLFTVGSKMHDADCRIPTLDRIWHAFAPVVHLPAWAPQLLPERAAPFTTVTQWNWGEIWDQPQLSVSKRAAYLRYLDIPRRSGRRFELALNMHPLDTTGDREMLAANGWTVIQAHEVTESPKKYQNYICGSLGEFCCPKAIYRTLNTGWMSDRSACYLAAGRPVLMEETGVSSKYPVGRGLLTFKNADEAAACVETVDSEYEMHHRAARDFAAAWLDGRQVVSAMISTAMASHGA